MVNSAFKNRFSKLEMAKKVSFHDQSRSKLVEGINIVANAVKITLGPKGRNVVLERSHGSPEIVNDGVTIARDIVLPDPEMNVGAKLIQEVASKSDNKAGDGTTTSTLMTQEIINQGMRVVSSGANPVSLRAGISLAASKLTARVKELSKPIQNNTDILSIATIASNSHVMGSVIAECYQKLGADGSTVVEESQTGEDGVEFTEGLHVDRGLLSPYFVKDQEHQTCEMQDAKIFVTDKKISSVQEIVGILEYFAKSKQPLLFIADDISGEALSVLVINKLRGMLDVAAIKAPSFGDRRKAYLQDIAIATGATFISDDFGIALDKVDASMLGHASRVVINKDSSTFVTDSTHKDQVAQRIQQLKAEMEATDSKYDKDKLNERISTLGGGIARIKVGAATETELKDKKLRYEDALNSVRSAIEMGIVPGGGSTMLFMSDDKELKNSILSACKNEDEKLGVEIMFRSLAAPMKQIALNAGLEGEIVVDKCRNKTFGHGFNAATGVYEDLAASGVIDPAKVTINAIENAASIASMVLTTEVLVTEIPQAKSKDSNAGGEDE